MGTITGAELAKDIGQSLTDSGFTNFDKKDDVFPAITEAQRAIVMLRADANPSFGKITLVSNSAMQALPSDGLSLSKITRNRGVNGATNGPAITRVDRKTMDQTLPGWPMDETADRIRNYIYEEDTPKLFFVYPIPIVALVVEAVIGKAPGKISADEHIIDIVDTYGPAIKEWALFRLQSMEREGASIELAMAHQTNFFNLMGIKMSNQITALRLKGLI